MSNKNLIANEDGFWAVFVIIVIVTLSIMTMSGYTILRSESTNVTNQINALKADYAIDGAAFYAVKLLASDTLDEMTALNVGSASVMLDTSRISGSSNILLTINATSGNISRTIEVELAGGMGFEEMAVYSTQWVLNIPTLDSTYTSDPTRLAANEPSMPTVLLDTLNGLSSSQGHDRFDATFQPSDEWPSSSGSGSFYQPDGITPNVTRVYGNLRVRGNRDVYGIFIVEGSVRLDGNARVHGVIYVVNSEHTRMNGGGNPSIAPICGALITNGTVQGHGNHTYVQHWPEYMHVFCQYVSGIGGSGYEVVNWEYM